MKKISIFNYYFFGTCVRYLQDASQGTLIHGSYMVLENIMHFFKAIKDFDFQVTSRAGMELNEFKDELQNLDKDAKLTLEQSNRLRRIMLDLRKTLNAEILGFHAFLLTPKRIDIKKLMEDVPSLFAPDVFPVLPDTAKRDFSEAGNCIAFSLSTAAAFHILRATEAVLRHFYCENIKQRRVKDLLWGPMVSDLRKRKKTSKYDALYNHLDNIRVNYRNPTQHPELFYDIHEVQDLWSLCTEVTNRMIKILHA